MSLITCPECKNKVSESADCCPNCGNRLSPEQVMEIKKNEQKEKESLKKFGLSLVVIIVAISIIGGITSSFSGSKSAKSEIVRNSEWDGSVKQVKSWLEENLKDPDSLQFVEWSPVQKTEDEKFTVRVKYRAKNSLGGYVVENKIFLLDSRGNIVNSSE